MGRGDGEGCCGRVVGVCVCGVWCVVWYGVCGGGALQGGHSNCGVNKHLTRSVAQILNFRTAMQGFATLFSRRFS